MTDYEKQPMELEEPEQPKFNGIAVAKRPRRTESSVFQQNGAFIVVDRGESRHSGIPVHSKDTEPP